MKTYRIVRMFRDDHRSSRRGRSGLTLEEARAHCQRSESHGGVYCDNDGCGYKSDVAKIRAEHGNLRCPKCDNPAIRRWFDGYEIER